MEGKITEQGTLQIKRGSALKNQFCPYASSTATSEEKWCGDWCPLFSEPENINGSTYLSLCRGRHIFPKGKFTDERK